MLKNQYAKRPCDSIKREMELLQDKYSIIQTKKTNSYGAAEYKCKDTLFRTFRGKLVNNNFSGLTFFKVIGKIEVKPEFTDWTKLK